MIVSIILFILILLTVLTLYLKWSGVPQIVWVIAFGAFAMRVGYVLVDTVFGIYAGGGDQTGFDTTFWFVAEQWRSGVIFAPLEHGASPGYSNDWTLLYSALFSPAYAIFGHIPALPRLQMSFVGTLVVVNIYLITREIHTHRSGLIAGTITACFPYWIVLSGIIYRDMLVIFFFTVMAYFFVRWQSDNRNLKFFTIMTLAAVIALHFREVNIIAVGALATTACFLLLGESQYGYVAGLIAAAGSVAAAYLSFGGWLPVERLASQRRWLSRENPGSYFTGWAYESVTELIVFAPIGAFYFALVPFPWHVIDLMSVVAIGQNLFIWYPIIILSIIGLRDMLFTPNGVKSVLPLLAFSLTGIFVYGLVEGNIGPVNRHRAQFQFIFFVLAGVTLAERIEIEWSTKSEI